MDTLFIGGGNMARAIIGGMLRGGGQAQRIAVIDPGQATREKLQADFGLASWESFSAWQDGQNDGTAQFGLTQEAALRLCVVWAVKPQVFKEAALGVSALEDATQSAVRSALHLSVMAGVSSQSIATALGASQVVRAMPNTPALIGQGITGLYARPEVSQAGRDAVTKVLQETGASLWFEEEAQLDAVTALSGSGPAYVFYLLEALVAAGEKVGLEAAQAKQLVLATFAGATALAMQSEESLAALRERVTSKGGTTFAALSALDEAAVGAGMQSAVLAAHRRAQELGQGA